jgi:hypothetical protein
MDESGISTVPNKLPMVIAEKGKRLVGKTVSADRGLLVTVVCCFSASGVCVQLRYFLVKESAMNSILKLQLELYA